jgi:carbon starvation protein
MSTVMVAIFAGVALMLAYHTYGRWLARRIFELSPTACVPSRELFDDVDYVPTRRQIIFGHHFTSIAGTGPIVGPAVAVFWGWLPALAWVVFGAIFIGAVHDFGALVVSLRNRGQTVGEVAGRLITPRTRLLFLVILFLALSLVLAVFGLVIAGIFAEYPESVLPTWISLPLAVMLGVWVHRHGGNLLLASLAAVAVIYLCVYLGAYYFPIDLTTLLNIKANGPFPNAVMIWTIILLIYCFVASVLPVWLLLQPRDYVNSHQLVVALVLLVGGCIVAGATGRADLAESTPAVVSASEVPADAPPIWPFLFITIACGACSGFHCLVSSGTTSKQIEKEPDAQYVAYGSMLLEGALAVLVILACCAGVGMGKVQRGAFESGQGYAYTAALSPDGQPVQGARAWRERYNVGAKEAWSSFRLRNMVQAFVEGGANFLTAVGLPLKLAIGVIAVLVACFAATTLDSATRLQRYVIQELAGTLRIQPLTNKYAATGLAVVLGGLIATIPSGQMGPGSGGLILWPLFGATNQLLAGLAFMVTAFYLRRRGKPIWFIVLPMVFMLIMPAWALIWQMQGFWTKGDYLLVAGSAAILAAQAWMVWEGLTLWPRVKGVLEEPLPPLVRA